MGNRFKKWHGASKNVPQDWSSLQSILLTNRNFVPRERLDYGDHGLFDVIACVVNAIKQNKRIALYADYDVDGTMSCVSWIWFLKAIGHENFVHYIPCRFKEGYGLNLNAVEHLIESEKAELIITMDTGITANAEAAFCKSKGVDFICTDHHKIQPDKMPDCLVLNPKLHPDEDYQQMCGCGITFVLLRKLAGHFDPPASLWTDLLALAGMATICDVVPLNGVNHQLARKGVAALMQSNRSVLKRLREHAREQDKVDEGDIGFRLGPRINAVGRLDHADQVVAAFVNEDPEPLIKVMGELNLKRREIQSSIFEQADKMAADHGDSPILFLGGDWHPGVVGIAASKIVEKYWKPTWLFCKKEGSAKGSARSIVGFDVTEAMQSCGELFDKFGGHKAAGGFSFPLEREDQIRAALENYAAKVRLANPDLWESQIEFDCELPGELLTPALTDCLDSFKPFGHCFERPLFLVRGTVRSVRHYNDKQTGKPKHTAYQISVGGRVSQKVVFFNDVHLLDTVERPIECIVEASRNEFQGQIRLDLLGYDYQVS